MNADNPIRVVLAADDGYSRPLAVTARSVAANLSPGRSLEIFVLDMGISDANKAAIRASLDLPRTRVIFVGDVGKAVEGLPTYGWFSTAAYGRLLIPDLLPEHVDRAIYLDSDVIVRHCLGELYDKDFEGKVALAVPDMGASFVCSPWGLAGWYEAGRSPSDFNFNSGMMLLDLQAWRREGIGRAALEYARTQHKLNLDQESINATAGTRIGAVEPRWTLQGEYFQRVCQLAMPYTNETIEAIGKDPWVIHYSLPTKPWQYRSDHPWTQEWFTYLEQTAYRGWRPSPPPFMTSLRWYAIQVFGPLLGVRRRFTGR
ncbi:MAG: glycosyltransferase family 8 protein [Steroidobacteraceae bacterium]